MKGILSYPRSAPAPVDKAALLAALAAAAALEEADYTPESWAVLASADTAGQAVYDDPDATQQQVDDASDAISAAINDLVPVSSACTIELTHDIVDADPSYLPADIDGNQFSVTSPTPDFAPYVASTSITDLKSLPATGMVWVEFRKSNVPSGITFQLVDAVTTDAINFFAPGSWFSEGFASVSLYEGGSFVGSAQLDSLGEVDSLMVGYNSAGELFVMDQYGVPRNVTEFPVDNSPLPTAPLSGFTAIAFVGGIIGSTELTGTASGQFVTDHEQFPYPPEGEAYDWCGNALPPKYDRDDLQQLLDDAAVLDEADYTPESWADLQVAVTAGQAVMDDPDATQFEVDTAVSAITNAINALVPGGDRRFTVSTVSLGDYQNSGGLSPEPVAFSAGSAIELESVTASQVISALESESDSVSGIYEEGAWIHLAEEPYATFSATLFCIIDDEVTGFVMPSQHPQTTSTTLWGVPSGRVLEDEMAGMGVGDRAYISSYSFKIDGYFEISGIGFTGTESNYYLLLPAVYAVERVS